MFAERGLFLEERYLKILYEVVLGDTGDWDILESGILLIAEFLIEAQGLVGFG